MVFSFGPSLGAGESFFCVALWFPQGFLGVVHNAENKL